MRPKSTLSNLRETTSIHFTFIWEDRHPRECLARDHAQRVWFQKYCSQSEQRRISSKEWMMRRNELSWKSNWLQSLESEDPSKEPVSRQSTFIGCPWDWVSAVSNCTMVLFWGVNFDPVSCTTFDSDSVPTQPYSAVQLIKTTTQSQNAILKWTVPNPSRRM